VIPKADGMLAACSPIHRSQPAGGGRREALALRLLRSSSSSSRTAAGACFVADLADEFFEDVFEGDGAHDPAVIGALHTKTVRSAKGVSAAACASLAACTLRRGRAETSSHSIRGDRPGTRSCP
jgi:hypothetical protein